MQHRVNNFWFSKPKYFRVFIIPLINWYYFLKGLFQIILCSSCNFFFLIKYFLIISFISIKPSFLNFLNDFSWWFIRTTLLFFTTLCSIHWSYLVKYTSLFLNQVKIGLASAKKIFLIRGTEICQDFAVSCFDMLILFSL